MIKIYNAKSSKKGEITLNDYIEFDENGVYEPYINSFGEIICDNGIKKANYDLMSLDTLYEYLSKLEVINKELKLKLVSPVDYNYVNKEFDFVSKSNINKYSSLIEEAVLLITDYVYLINHDDKVKKIYSRCPETGLYVVEPNAQFTMRSPDYSFIKHDYELLQSRNAGKRLILSRMDHII